MPGPIFCEKCGQIIGVDPRATPDKGTLGICDDCFCEDEFGGEEDYDEEEPWA